MRVVFSSAAENDLTDIAVYIAQDNPARAFSFTDELEDRARSLANMPNKGANRQGLRHGLRLLLHGAYGIYYEVEEQTVTILRIMHGARDVTSEDFT